MAPPLPASSIAAFLVPGVDEVGPGEIGRGDSDMLEAIGGRLADLAGCHVGNILMVDDDGDRLHQVTNPLPWWLIGWGESTNG